MSVQSLAQNLQAQGRNGDSMLVHMTPREVGGLQSLAQAYGGSLTINPTTGLPEANFLEAILPTVLGVGLSFIPGVGPLAAAGITGGATALATGDVEKGLMAGLGAYGGAGLGSSLQTLGAAAPGSAAMGALGDEAVSSGLMGSAADIAATAPVTAAPTGFAANAANAKAGLQAAAQAPGQFLSNNLMNIGAASAPILGATPEQEMPETEEGDIRQYGYTQEVNPSFGMPGQPYFNQTYTPMGVTPVEDFQGFSDGGDVEGPYKRSTRTIDPAVTQYNQQLMQRAQAEYNQTPPPAAFRSAVPGQGVYDPQAGAALQAQRAQMAGQPQIQPQATQFGYAFDPVTNRVVKTTPSEDAFTKLQEQITALQNKSAQERPYDPDDQQFGNAAGGIMRLARGGYTLGDYSDGGRLLRGPGDGVSDDIPATIEGKQPARLAEGEFVIPARIVSEIGNGSTEAGAKRLYAMMDRVQKNRAKTTGKDKVAKNTRSYKELPA